MLDDRTDVLFNEFEFPIAYKLPTKYAQEDGMAATKKTAPRAATPKTIEPEEMHFRAVADILANEHEEVTWGKMMLSPGIRSQGRQK